MIFIFFTFLLIRISHMVLLMYPNMKYIFYRTRSSLIIFIDRMTP